jgi:AraC-like DNA-binding protein
MDRHDLPEAVTAEAVAKVHQEDLKIQQQYRCRGLAYWFDEKRHTAFCLIEAPEENAVKNMHNQAHGMIPNQIIRVDTQLVNAFLGRIENPSTEGSPDLAIINETAFRTIMITCLPDLVILKARLGKENVHSFITQHDDVIRTTIEKFGGREVKHLHGSFIVSFPSTLNGLHCAKEILNKIKQADNNGVGLKIKIGIGAGLPVNENPKLFGQTIHLTQRLCNIAGHGQIVISSEVNQQLTYESPGVIYEGETKALNPETENFLNRLIDIIESKWNVSNFNIPEFGKKLGVSKAQLYRKIIDLSGFSPNNFIKEYRLKKAAEAICNHEGNVSEIAYSSGFSSPSYFSKCFQERFGILPSSFAASVN